MTTHKIGDKSRAICELCHGIRSTTFRERDVPLSSGNGTVPDLLVSVCDDCDTVVAIPAQSVSKIRETLQRKRRPSPGEV